MMQDGPDRERTPRLTVATYNIRYAGLDDGPRAWERRRDEVAATIRAAAPDVIALQECWLDQRGDLEDLIPTYEWVGEADRTGEHTPIGYDPTRITVESSGTFGVAPNGERGVIGWDGLLPRTVTHATLCDRVTNAEFTVVSVHLDHQGTRARVEGARLIDDRLPDHPTVVAGDLNCEPGTEPYQILTAALEDAHDAAGERTGRDETYIGYEGGPMGETPTPRPRRIDYVFVRGFRVVTYATVALKGAGVQPSDHLPVVVEVCFTDDG